MNVFQVSPSGYCKGVVNAITIAKKTRRQYPDSPIYVAGMIVHNVYVAEALKKLDIITLERENLKQYLDTLGGVIIFSAHGIAPKIKEYALDKGWIVVDASCVDVLYTQQIIKEKLEEDYEIFYIGKKNHPEAEAVLSLCERIHLVENEDISNLKQYPKVFVTNQTTMSVNELSDIYLNIQNQYPHALIQNEICHATSQRQQAIKDLKDCDLLYVVGDPHSNNTRQLANIASNCGIKTRMIETAKEIDINDLSADINVYVTSGASTPPYLSRQVLQCLKEYADTGILNTYEIDINKIL